MNNISFKFIKEYGFEAGNLETLTPIQIAQLHACLPLYYGEEEAAEIDKSNIGNLFDEETERWAFASLYHIIDNGTNEVLYDFWEYNADSGTIFVHNSKEHIGIFMMQFDFGLVEKNEYNRQLPENFADILQKAFKEIND